MCLFYEERFQIFKLNDEDMSPDDKWNRAK